MKSDGINSVRGTDLHDIIVEIRREEKESLEAVDADCRRVSNRYVVVRIRDIIGVRTHDIISRASAYHSKACLDIPC